MRAIFVSLLLMLAVPAQGAQADEIRMKVEGRDWAASDIVATVVSLGASMAVSITGKLKGAKISALSFQFIPAALQNPVGHYELRPGMAGPGTGSSGMFNVDMLGGDPMEDSFHFQSGMLDVTAYDAATHKVTGSFAGVMVNNAKSKKITIADGILSAVEIAQ